MKTSEILKIFSIVLTILFILALAILFYIFWRNRNMFIKIDKHVRYPSLIEQLTTYEEPDNKDLLTII